MPNKWRAPQCGVHVRIDESLSRQDLRPQGKFRVSHLCDEVDGHTLTPETTRPTYTVDVVLAVGREVVVDD